MTDGNYWLIACAIAYLIWWAVAFNPSRRFPFSLKVALFLVTLAAGIVGVVIMIGAIAATPPEATPFPPWAIALIALGVYIVVAVVTARLLHRQVTTELALIIGWLALELTLIECLFGTGVLTFPATIAAFVIALVAAGGSMGCYLVYYRLARRPAFYLGMAPLGLFAAAMVAINVLAAVA